MADRTPGPARGLALTLMVVAALGAGGWLWGGAVRRSDLNFLPTRAPAQWIVYAAAPAGVIRPRTELPGIFRAGLDLKETPARAELRVAGFHRFSILINGRPPGLPSEVGRNWKDPDRFEVAPLLRAGKNEVVVTVVNSNGPPALWLTLETGNARLTSGENWQVSFAGATTRPASLATRSKSVPPGSTLSGGPTPREAFARQWQWLVVIAALSGAIYWLLARSDWIFCDHSANRWRRAGWRREVLALSVLAAGWIALFVNNLGALPNLSGFDVAGHMDYVTYILTRHALPTASEGWEMFQPPLYYLLGATWVRLTGLLASPTERVLALRILGLGIGLGHLVIVWASLRRLFPGRVGPQRWGVLLAAALPPMLYLSQFVTNETLAAALVSLSLYLTLRLLQAPEASWRGCAGLGVCLGLALLAKVTALLALPPILGALAWKWLSSPPLTSPVGASASAFGPPHPARWQSLARLLLILLVCAAVCGWHFIRVWERYGNPWIGVWDPKAGFAWWQDDGFRTAPFYLRFGQALVQPWFSAFRSFWDGIYTTLWGDGLLSGAADHLVCPPWNYDLMAVGFWLALGPTAAVVLGGVAAVRHFVRHPSPAWFLVLGLGLLTIFAVVQMSLAAPYYCAVKAFYGLAALVPFCAIGGWGMDLVGRWGGKWRWLTAVLLGTWAVTSVASFWISRDASATALIQARSLLLEGRSGEAAALMRARLGRAPEDNDARELLATVLGETEEASELATTALTADPERASRHLILAMALGSRKVAEATDHARRALELAPGYPAAFPTLTALLLYEQNFAEAAAVAREGLANDPLNRELHLALAIALVHTNQAEEGAAQLEMVVALTPNNAQVRAQVAGLYQVMGQTQPAITQFKEALRLEPYFGEALNGLAWIRATDPDPQVRDGVEAVALAERANEGTGYQQPLLVRTLAAAYAEAGRFEEAVTTAGKARELALAAGQAEEAAKIAELISTFRASKAWREAVRR